jgi:hypothetical protein
MHLAYQWEGATVAKAFDMLTEGGVPIDHIYEPVDGPIILVNGVPWTPTDGLINFHRGPLGQTYNPQREP